MKGSMQYPVSDFVTNGESISSLEATSALRCPQGRADFDLILEGGHPPQDPVAVLIAKKRFSSLNASFLLLGEYVE